jgi:hypothetical protein
VAGWQRVHLDELPALDGPGSLTWRPVRAELDLRAFGTNAYTAAAAGDDVVEPHTENPDLAHEELYFVHRGAARFTLGGESFDAPEGTYVRVTDPAIHRHAVALEPGTTVLSFGGPRTFKPSAWEYGWRAARAEDLHEARQLLDEGERQWPDSARIMWDRARVELRAGDEAAARAALEEIRRRYPGEQRVELEEHLRADPDLAALFGD